MQIDILDRRNLVWNQDIAGLKIPGENRDCDNCHALIDMRELEQNLLICPACGAHFRLKAWERIQITADKDTFQETETDIQSLNPIQMVGYEQKLRENKEKTDLSEGVITGTCKITGHDVVLAVMAFEFMGGSMGSVVGEKITRAILLAADLSIPVIIFTTSGGARMQEGLFSLMQMAKTSHAAALLNGLHIPMFTVLLDPTMGGITASFAMLGDVILAEPGAMIGFAGRRVIEGTIQESLPSSFQTAEFQREKGFVDSVVDRRALRSTLRFLIETHKNNIL